MDNHNRKKSKGPASLWKAQSDLPTRTKRRSGMPEIPIRQSRFDRYNNKAVNLKEVFTFLQPQTDSE